MQHIRLKIEMSKNLFSLLLHQKLSATTSSCVSSAVLDALSLYFRCSRKQHRFDAYTFQMDSTAPSLYTT